MTRVTALNKISLDDKYRLSSGRVYMSGTQALVRLPMTQRARDLRNGLNTAGFISGYRGSPLGNYDNALWQARGLLTENGVTFQPGLNEELAATSLWGSQQVGLLPGAKVDGVFGIWYGKGPGVDRAADALKHGNAAGSSPNGGVICLAGDDHGAQSSTLAHQSEQIFQAAMMPVLNPATVQEYLSFGLYGFALSRFSGSWIGFKAVTETVESSASISLEAEDVCFEIPAFEAPPGGLNIRWPDPPAAAERRLHVSRMDAVAAFAQLNPIDRLLLDPPGARLGIMTTGKAYLDVRQALADLGLDDAALNALGVRLYKVGMTWPLEAAGARRFADGLKSVLVVEEKRGFLEDQLLRIIYHLDASRRPVVAGKATETGEPLLPSYGELNPIMVARAIIGRLEQFNAVSSELRQRMSRLESFAAALELGDPGVQRTPYFCSGCPHNSSTKVPEGSRAMAGIGCHSMAVFVPTRKTALITQMGGEGANWIGQAPFTDETHVFQNLGDGTYSHSGLLAIRAAAASGVNITYKILYNDAVAMTGGQPVEGQLTVPQISRQVAAEGAKRVVVVSDEPGKYTPKDDFWPDAEIRHRDDLESIQRDLRETPGLTVLIYDQVCAAEKRRRRKRGLYPDPPKRLFINSRVCEGCGDCSAVSNCVSVQPLETDLGRKRVIDQSNCNKDYSCVGGFCPSFVTVKGGVLRKASPRGAGIDALDALPPPPPAPLLEPYNILVTGIGGAGVITVGALLAMAAHLEGKGCSTLDFTGLAQKNGAVMSHVRLAPSPDDLHAVRVAAGAASLVLGCDMVVAASREALTCVETGVTKAVINSRLQPTAAFVIDPDTKFENARVQRTLREAVGQDEAYFIDGSGLATALMGDSIATNLFMLGYALQKGMVPLSLEALERAIELNGVAVELNKKSLAWGRMAAHDMAAVQAIARQAAPSAPSVAEGLDQLVERHAALLTDYQDAAYARRYRKLVDEVAALEARLAPGRKGLAQAVARNFYKLMAYKDEYEVARLFVDGQFAEDLKAQFEGDFKLEYHLAAPLFSARDRVTGHLKKRRYGEWMRFGFKILARLKGLRGTPLDIFGRTEERRTERRLIVEYEALMRRLAAELTSDNHPVAVSLAEAPQQIRGYGHIKHRGLERAQAEQSRLLSEFSTQSAVFAAE